MDVAGQTFLFAAMGAEHQDRLSVRLRAIGSLEMPAAQNIVAAHMPIVFAFDLSISAVFGAISDTSIARQPQFRGVA